MAFHLDRTPINENAFLFRRQGSRYWYVQTTFPGVRNPRASSTGREDLGEARSIAMERYKAALRMVLDDRPLTAPTFREATEDFIAWLRSRPQAATSSERYVKDYKGYMCEYFGSRKINTLTPQDARDYAKWRQTNFRKSRPKNQTINREINTLRHLMAYCVERKWLPEGQRPALPTLPTSRDRQTSRHQPVDEPRSSWFSPAEYIVLRRLHWQHVNETHDPFERSERLYQHYLIQLQYYLGCRTEEIFNLSHNDYKDHRYPDGDFLITSVYIKLEGSGKVREIVAPAIVRPLLHRLRDLTHQPKSGKVAPVNPQNYFYNFMRRSGLYLDEYGIGRSRTSLRHTRATIELYYRRDKVSPLALAVFMGHTVAEQERTYSKIFRILQSEALHMRSRRTGRLNLATQWLREARAIQQRLSLPAEKEQ